MRHNSASFARERSDLGHRSGGGAASKTSQSARVNEAAPRGPQERLGSLSRAISVDAAYSGDGGQWRPPVLTSPASVPFLFRDVHCSLCVFTLTPIPSLTVRLFLLLIFRFRLLLSDIAWVDCGCGFLTLIATLCQFVCRVQCCTVHINITHYYHRPDCRYFCVSSLHG